MFKNPALKKFQKIVANTITFSLMLIIIGFGSNALAGSSNSSSDTVTTATTFTNPIEADDLSALLTDLLEVVTTIGAVVVVFFLILAGFKYVTARGDTKKISEAHSMLTWTVVGAMILLGAQVIATAIEGTIKELQ